MPGMQAMAAVEIEIKADTTVIAGFYTSTAPLNDADLHAHAAAKLARYKCPRAYIRVDSLPQGPNGKILRRALRGHNIGTAPHLAPQDHNR